MPVRSWLNRLFLVLTSNDEKKAFQEAITRQNVSRLRPIAVLTLILESIMFLRALLSVANGTNHLRVYAYMALYLIMALLMCFTLILLRRYRDDPESGVTWAGVLAPVGTFTALLWAATITLVEMSGQVYQGAVFMGMQYLMMALLILPPIASLVMLLGVQGIFLIGVFMLYPDPEAYHNLLINLGINAVLAWAVSRATYSGALRQYRATRTIHEKNTQLSELNKVLGELSITDPLTMLMNRRQFDRIADQEWRRACREGHRLTVAIADVDDFKPYNDIYGHLAGDECLHSVAAAMKSVLRRATDTLARFGGEEFIILLRSDSSLKDAVTMHLVKDAVAALQMPHKGSRASDVVTVSIGCYCMTPTPDVSIQDMIERADKALYEAKGQGRNKVVFVTDT